MHLMCGSKSIEAAQTGFFPFLNQKWNALILAWNKIAYKNT